MSMKTAGTLLVAVAALTAGCLSFDGLDGSKESYEEEARAKRDAGATADTGSPAADAGTAVDATTDAATAVDASVAQDSGTADATVTTTDAASPDASAISDASNVDGSRDAGNTSPTDAGQDAQVTTDCRVLSFDGNDDYATTATTAGVDYGAAYTVEGWFQADRARAQSSFATEYFEDAIFLHGGCCGGVPGQNFYNFVWLDTKPSDPVLKWMIDLGQNRVLGSVTTTFSEWHHVAVQQTSNTHSMYLDGRLVASGSGQAIPPAGAGQFPLQVGGGQGAQATRMSFGGLLGPQRVSSVARYTGPFVPAWSWTSDSSTVALYGLSGGSGNTVNDNSGNGRTLTLSGATWATVACPSTQSAPAPATANCTSCTAAGTVDGVNNCGPNGNEVCGTSLYVPGGTYYRGDTANYPATISSFRLDKYEVTVGRFRKFVDAWVGGWRPAAGSGKHTHLNGGQGLANTAGGYETGWDSAWTAYVGAPSALAATPSAPGAASRADWDSALRCGDGGGVWAGPASANERRPADCLSWYDLQAFCVWDGGFLSSEAEFEYAVSGGNEERTYPWGSATPDAQRAVFGTTVSADVGSKPNGSGRWGHVDLAGNLVELVADYASAGFSGSCANCVNLVVGTGQRAIRNAAYTSTAAEMRSTTRGDGPAAGRYREIGGRCARTP